MVILGAGNGSEEVASMGEGDDKVITTDKGSINLTVLKKAMVRLSEEGPTVCTENGK